MRFSLYFFLSIVSISFSQSSSISGVVKNDRGEHLVGTNVFIEGTLLGAATDISGSYIIEKVPSDRTYKITAMYIGHRTMTKEIETKQGESLTVDFELVLSLVDLDEVVVAASFSERKKRAQASPVTIISQDELRRLPVRSIDEILNGKVPGGFANLPHRPGQNNYAFTMRGGTSGTGRPLGDVKIYIDGIELLGFDMQSEPGIADFIDPSDIERIEVVRGPMGSTLHGSNAQSGIIQIFTKKGSESRKTVVKMKFAQKITEAPILNDNAIGQEASFSMSGGSSSNVSYNWGFNSSRDDEVMPSNGKDIEQLKAHGSINARIGATVIDVKTYHSWGQQGFISNLYHLLEYKENRSWTEAPDHWDDSLSNGGTSYYKPGFSLNITHSFTPDWYQSLVIGNDSKRFLYKKYNSLFPGQSYLTQNWNRYTLNYFWHFKKRISNSMNVDLTTGTQRTVSNHVRLSGSLDEVKDQYYYEDFDNASIVDQSNKNAGYYAELVVDYNDRMFLTFGERIEQNEYFGKDYGTHYSPRIGFSYVSEIGGILYKSRAAWGSGGINPPQAMQALPSESSTSINIGNPDLRPERQSGFEFGGDFYFGDNFFVEVTYFDQLFLDGISNDRSINDPFTPKEENWYINLGQIINKGWEISAKTRFGPLDISGNYSILDSRWGEDTLRQNDPSFEGFYDKGTRRNDVPQSTGNLSLAYSIPGFSVISKKGGSVVLDINYIGKKKGRDWLLYYDGLYDPDTDPFTYYSKDFLIDYKPYTTVRLRFSYWLSNKYSAFLDIRNLTEHKDISRSITEPALGKQVIIGLDLEL